MGREEEIAYAREHGIPVKGGTEVSPVLDRRQPLGPLLGGPGDRGPRRGAPGRRLPARHPARGRAGRAAGRQRSDSSAAGPVSLDGEQLGLVELLERAAEIGERHGVGIVDHIEDRVVGLKVRDLYEVPAAAIVLAAHRELEKLVCTIHQNNFKGALESHWAYLCYAGLWLEPLRTTLTPTWTRSTSSSPARWR